MSPGSENKIRRILVGMDPGSDYRSLLNTARELAEAVNAELLGHFVEESALLNISSLPFARSIIQGETKTRTLSLEQMKEAIELQARRFENALSNLEMETNLHCSIRRSNGDFLTEIQASATDQDLVIVQGTPSGFTISSMMNDIRGLATGFKVVTICPGTLQTCQGPIVILDEGEDLHIGLDLAKSLSRSHGVPIISLQLGNRAEMEASTQKEDETQFDKVQFVSIPHWNMELLSEILRHYRPGYIIGNLNSELFNNNRLTSTILRSIRTPLILLP